jgi:predicted nucleic acid-binding protein
MEASFTAIVGRENQVMIALYLDMNIYNRPFDDQSQMRIRLETTAALMIFALAEQRQVSVKWSFVLEYENSQNPFSERKGFVKHLAYICSETIEPDPSIREMARCLTEEYGVRGRDALHIACAAYAGCDYLVTCDDRLVRQGQRLRGEDILTLQIVNPIDVLQEV